MKTIQKKDIIKIDDAHIVHIQGKENTRILLSFRFFQP